MCFLNTFETIAEVVYGQGERAIYRSELYFVPMPVYRPSLDLLTNLLLW